MFPMKFTQSTSNEVKLISVLSEMFAQYFNAKLKVIHLGHSKVFTITNTEKKIKSSARPEWEHMSTRIAYILYYKSWNIVYKSRHWNYQQLFLFILHISNKLFEEREREKLKNNEKKKTILSFRSVEHFNLSTQHAHQQCLHENHFTHIYCTKHSVGPAT